MTVIIIAVAVSQLIIGIILGYMIWGKNDAVDARSTGRRGEMKCHLCGEPAIWTQSPLSNPDELALCEKCHRSINEQLTKLALKNPNKPIYMKYGQPLYTGETKRE